MRRNTLKTEPKYISLRRYITGRWNDEKNRCEYLCAGYNWDKCEWKTREELLRSPHKGLTDSFPSSDKHKHVNWGKGCPKFKCKVFVTFKSWKDCYGACKTETKSIKFTNANHWQKLESLMEN